MAGIIPLYVDRWLGGTRVLSLEERGAFIDWIASYAARDGLFPDDIRLFASIWGCETRRARRLRAALLAKGKLYVEGGLTHQVFANSVVAKALAKSEQATNAAYKRWENHRKNNGNGAASAYTSAHASADADGPHSAYATPREERKKASSLGESQHTPPVDNPPVTEQDPIQQDPSASARATALPEGAPARSPPTQQDTPLTLAEINARWRPAGTRP